MVAQMGTHNLWLTKQYSLDDDSSIYHAIPVSAVTSDDNIPEVTSDSDLSLVNCYDVENSKIYHQSPDGTNQEIRIQVNTQGLLYYPKDFEKIENEKPNEEEVVEQRIQVNTQGLLYYPTDEETKTEEVTEKQSQINIEKLKMAPEQTTKNPIPLTRTFITKEPFTPSPVETPTSPLIINKKSDNTLIKKIYSNPVVRSFALVNRAQIPVDLETKPEENQAVEEVPITPIHTSTPLRKISYTANPEATESVEEVFSNNNNTFSLEFSDTESMLHREHSIEKNDITQLKEKRLVANRLGEFSKSFPNLSRIHLFTGNGTIPRQNLSDRKVSVGVRVKDLKRLFERNDESFKDKPVHSLTARSLSKQMKDTLKNQNVDLHQPEFV